MDKKILADLRYNKITISGKAGSRKSTVGKHLAASLGYEYISVGEYSRKFALENLNMDINEFQEYCKTHPEIDVEIDEKFREYCNCRTQLVIDYRLGFHFIENAFNIFLDVSDQIAAGRIANANRQNEKTSAEEIMKRNENMRQRFLELYKVDFFDLNNYNTVINSDVKTVEQIIENILDSII